MKNGMIGAIFFRASFRRLDNLPFRFDSFNWRQLGIDLEKNYNFAHLPIDLSNSIIQVIHKISSAP